MNKKIDIKISDYELLQNILKKYKYTFYVYGSRVKNKARQYSDLDIFCKEKISDLDMANLVLDLEESNISIKIDIVDINNCSEKFYHSIAKDLVAVDSM